MFNKCYTSQNNFTPCFYDNIYKEKILAVLSTLKLYTYM